MRRIIWLAIALAVLSVASIGATLSGGAAAAQSVETVDNAQACFDVSTVLGGPFCLTGTVTRTVDPTAGPPKPCQILDVNLTGVVNGATVNVTGAENPLAGCLIAPPEVPPGPDLLSAGVDLVVEVITNPTELFVACGAPLFGISLVGTFDNNVWDLSLDPGPQDFCPSAGGPTAFTISNLSATNSTGVGGIAEALTDSTASASAADSSSGSGFNYAVLAGALAAAAAVAAAAGWYARRRWLR